MSDRVKFTSQVGGGYIVWINDERLGFVRRSDDRRWHATDTYMVALRRDFASRKNAVNALLRRRKREART